MQIKLEELRQLIREAVVEAVSGRSPSAKKMPPASIMKSIVDAVSSLGYAVLDREKTPGALKTWMSRPKTPKVKGKPSSPSGAFGIEAFKKALSKFGLTSTLSQNDFETSLQGDGFKVVLPVSRKDGEVGVQIFIMVYAGKMAGAERRGIDTSDYM